MPAKKPKGYTMLTHYIEIKEVIKFGLSVWVVSIDAVYVTELMSYDGAMQVAKRLRAKLGK